MTNNLLQDIGIASDVAQLVKEASQKLGGLDIIVNNASWTRFAVFSDINDLSLDEWNKVLVKPELNRTVGTDKDSAGQPMSCHN